MNGHIAVTSERRGRRERRGWVGLWGAAALGLALAASLSSADETPVSGEPLDFRRVQIRPEQLSEYARGYLPVRETEFEQLVAAARRQRGGENPLTLSCQRAEYVARFENDALRDGQARLEVSAGRELPSLWYWGETELPVVEPLWLGEPTRPAQLGLAPSGRQAVVVERPGTLQFAWSLQGKRLSRDVVAFRFAGPRALLQTLILDLPATLTPQAESAILVAEPGEPAGAARRKWTLQWHGSAPLELRLVAAAGRRAGLATTRVRQTLHYAVDLRGVELQADLHLDVLGEPMRTLTLAVDPRLRIGTARLGDRTLTWSRRWKGDGGGAGGDGAASSAGSSNEIVISMPDVTGEDRRLQVTALAPPELGGRWKLPFIQPLGVQWLETESHVTVVEPLVATRLDVAGGRLVFAAAGERRRSWQARIHEPDGALTLFADVPPARWSVRAGTTIAIERTSLTGRCVAEITPLTGATQTLDLELPRVWLIDSIESQAGPTVEDYQLVSGGTAGRQAYRVRLREPLAVGHALRLALVARRQAPATNVAVASDQLRLVRFRDGGGAPHELNHVVAVNSAPNVRLRFSGDQAVRWLDPTALRDARDSLVEVSGGGRVYQVDSASEDLELRLERDRPRFRGEIEASALVRDGRLLESYRIRLTPDASLLDRVPVFFSQARTTALRWEVAEPAANSPTFRLVPRPEGGAGLAGETWEVAFPRPVAGPIVLTAERSSVLEGPQPLSLASLPDAAEQTGAIWVAALLGESRWTNQGLAFITDVPAAEAERAAERLGVVPGTVSYFRYEPAGEGALLVQPPDASAVTPRAWAWRGRWETIIAPDGVLRHRCEYDVENVGALEIDVELDAALRLERLLVEDQDRTPPQPTVASSTGVGGRFVRCPLPATTPRARVVLELSAPHAELSAVSRLRPPQVTESFPVLRREWRVNVPEPWAVTAVRAVSPGERVGWFDAAQLWPGTRWYDRLFGLLRRPVSRERAGVAAADWWSSGTPGPAGTEGSESPGDRLSWHAFQMELPVAQEIELRLRRTDGARAYAWCALLLTVGLGGWLGRRWPWILPAWALIPGIAALVVPPLYALIAGGAFLGGCLAPLAVAGTWRGRPPGSDAGGNETRGAASRRRVAATAVCGLVASLGLGSEPGESFARAWAQEEPPRRAEGASRGESTPERSERPRSVIYRVLAPVDENRQRVGEYVHLPREFYRELRRRAESGETDAGAWLLRSAEYDAVLREGEIPSLDVTADYAVEVRQAGGAIRWPFVRQTTTIVDARVARGAESIEAEWQVDETGWTWRAPQPGLYRVTFRWRLTAEDAEATRFEVPVPPVSTSRIRLRSDGAPGRLSLAGEVFGALEAGERGERVATLGAVSRLAFVWTAESTGGSAGAAEQLLWLHIRPGSVQLDLVLRLPPQVGPASRQARLRLEPSLRLLPVVLSPGVVRTQVLPGNPPTLAVEIAESQEPIDVRLSFLVTGASGVGRVPVPRVDWFEGRIERRWLAITSSPMLDVAPAEGQALEPLNVLTFLESWGPSEALPIVAYRLSADDDGTLFAVRQRDADWTASESRTFHLRRDRCELAYVGEIAPGSAPHFQYELTGSGALRVLEVVVLDSLDGTSRPIRWAVDSSGTLRILADQPLAGPHRVQVRADFALPIDKETPLPTLALVTRQIVPRTMRVWRQTALAVDLAGLDGWREWRLDTEEPADASPSQQLVGAWSWTPGVDGSEPAIPTARLKLNRPRVRGRVVTTLRRAAEGWEAVVSGRLQAERGTVEMVRLEVPPEAKGPWVGEGDARWNPVEIPGQTRMYLVGPAPRHEGGDDWSFRLRGPLVFGRQDRVRVPDLQLLDVTSSERFFALPVLDQEQRIAWETSGLRAVVQPDAWLEQAVEEADARRPAGPSRYQLYQVVAPRFQAAVEDIEDEAAEPRVKRAEHTWHESGVRSGWGESRLVVQCGTHHECVVDLPPAARLLLARVAGTPAVMERLSDGGWRIPLAEDRSVQELDLLYAAADSGESSVGRATPSVRQWRTDEIVSRGEAPVTSEAWSDDRWIAGILLTALVIACGWASSFVAWRDWLASSPALPAVVAGLTWWLFFQPAAVGLVVAAAGLLVANWPVTFRLGTRRSL